MGKDLEVKEKDITATVKNLMYGGEKYYDIMTTMEGDNIVYLIVNHYIDTFITVNSHDEIKQYMRFIMRRKKK